MYNGKILKLDGTPATVERQFEFTRQVKDGKDETYFRKESELTEDENTLLFGQFVEHWKMLPHEMKGLFLVSLRDGKIV